MKADELELKALLGDPDSAVRALATAGAEPTFSGMMEDRKFDRDGELTARDEVLRVRVFRPADSALPSRARVAWKGPTQRSPQGYKLRQELEFDLTGAPASAAVELFLALGYRVVLAIDRWVQIFNLGGAEVRLEWYPRMDTLIEIEGDPPAIEAAIGASGLPRALFHPESLPEFVARYEARTGQQAILALKDLHGAPPGWHLR
jgi:adenylate cyclase class IV